MIEAINLVKKYNNETVISDFNLKIMKGEILALTGESGKGKTTVLNMLGMLERPDGGQIVVEGNSNLRKKEIMHLQRHKLGYLFQNYALIENETVKANLKIALGGRKILNKISAMKEALHFVNLKPNILDKKVYQLSGGEQQRVAIARLFLKEADYIFADEPTGNLDVQNRNIVFDLLKKMSDMGKAVVFVTHDLELAQKSTRWIEL
ncbi:MAG: ATP-binding cassette domain-containing protein [Turicibacter sp.]|nr:ATP-binding cassette domain-containing protein [Turicibacter sp.]